MNTGISEMACAILLLTLGLVMGSGYGRAQVSSASLTGIVNDPTGAVIPGSSVVLTNKNTGERRNTTSDEAGRYAFSLLIPGPYELNVESAGFRRAVVSDIVLNAGQRAEANVTLQVGDVVETVEVVASSVQLDTQSADQNTSLVPDQITELPINFRNPLALVFTTAGVGQPVGQAGIRSLQESFLDMDWGLFAMNGGRAGSNTITMDGLSAKGGDWGQTFGTPQVDAVQEMQISRNAYDAEYARVGNGVVNLVTRGGSSEWHGTAFEFIRNDKLDANKWSFNRNGVSRPPLKRNQLGGNVSGPIWRDRRLFFLFGYEGARIRETGGVTSTFPTSLEREGDFSQSRNANGSLQEIYDPFTTRSNPAGSGFVRDPFVGNRIPRTRFDEVGAGATNHLLPMPNQAGVPITNANNFFGSSRHPRDANRWDSRVDWVRTEKHSMFFHLTRNYFDEINPRIYNQGAEDQRISPHGVDRGGRVYQATLSNTFVPSPTWIVNGVVGGGGNVSYARSTSLAEGFDLTTIGYSTAFRDLFPTSTIGRWNIADYLDMGSAGDTTGALRTNSLSVNVSNERGAHSIKFGFSGDVMILNNLSRQTITMDFNRGPTTGPVALPGSNVSGNTIASLLLGVGSGSTPTPLDYAASHKYLGWYVQDTWRATNRLTLTLGLRYELNRPRSERYDRQNYFDYDLDNPLGDQVGLPLRGGLVFSTPEDRGQTLQDRNDLAPRFGLAYKVTERLVVRSGYGISYGRSISEAGVNGNNGFSTTTPWIVNPGGVVPLFLLSNPFPQGRIQPTGNADGSLTFVGLSPTAWRRNNPTPYLQSYSLDVQYQFRPSTMFEIGYTGNVGRKYAWGTNSLNNNQLHPQYLSLGQRLNDLVPNPFFNIIETGPLSGSTVPFNQLLRPHPHFAGVIAPLSEKGASSSFNALFLKFTHRVSGGLSLLSTYQWSKSIDNASEDQGWWMNDGRRDVYDASLERSVSSHDVPHDFVNSLIYELPVGRGKKFGSGMSGVAQALLGGWQVSGTIRFASGTPLNLRAPNTLSDFGFAVQRPNVANLKDIELDHRTPEQWWNTTALTAPGPFEVGNAPRFFSNIRLRTMTNADLNLTKNFTLMNEKVNAQFRAEAYNLTNTPLFGIPPQGPQVTLGSGAFGTVTDTFLVGPRQVQLGLKLSF